MRWELELERRRIFGASWPELLAVLHLAVDHVAITDFWVHDPAQVAIARHELEELVCSLVGQPTALARLSIDAPYYRSPVPAPLELRRGADGKLERVA